MTTADRCPGVLRPHRAEDGLMVRLRLPGGRTTGARLAAASRLAGRYGNPELQLTSRAGLQLRGLPDPVPPALVDALTTEGFLPSRAHDRVRNVLASPLTGVQGGRDDVTDLVAALDRAILADRRLTDLPGRFLFAVDDGRADVTAAPFDLAYRAETVDAGHLLVGTDRLGLAVPRRQAVGRLVALARDFLIARAGAAGRGWHVRDLAGWAERVGARPLPPGPRPEPVPLGAVGGAASVLVPLGMLAPEQVAAVAVAGTREVVLTPDRGLVLPGAAAALPDLVATGLVADAGSPWTLVSACVGAPHCGRTDVDTRSVARDLVGRGELAERVHVSGCGRRCGAPTAPHRELVGAA